VQSTEPEATVNLDEICAEIAYFVNSGLSGTRVDPPTEDGAERIPLARQERPTVEADVS
jgi:hypothetical protein